MKRDIRSELLNRGLSDMLQLGEMAWVARRDLGESSSEPDIMQATIKAIGELLSCDYAIVGDVMRDEGLLCVRSWGLSAAETIKRIEEEWRALGHMPNLGEVCWLELTDPGREEARALAS